MPPKKSSQLLQKLTAESKNLSRSFRKKKKRVQRDESKESVTTECTKEEVLESETALPHDVIQEEITKCPNYQQWYHGMMPRHEIEDLLKRDGDFLVRRTEVGNRTRYAISVYFNKRIRHILLNFEEGKWAVRGEKKSTIIELIQHFRDTKAPLQSEGTILITPIPCPDYYILHELIEVGKKLGGGAFGDVHLGLWKKNQDEKVEIAIKKLKGKMHKRERTEFVKEASLMLKFNHPNIVHLIGICPNESPILIVLELCPGGALNSHLKKNPDLNQDKLIQYCVDACRGMVYLSQRKVIHRDIAARNCLLGKNDECKISDFGLSVANTDIIKLDKLKSMPVRWLSPETLKKGEFSTKSDVWSYGVMQWEVFMHCKSDPYPGMTNLEARAKITSGVAPLDPPEGMPDMIKQVYQLCFTQDAAERPDFLTLFKMLAPNEKPPLKEEEQQQQPKSS